MNKFINNHELRRLKLDTNNNNCYEEERLDHDREST
jgi:hypothetical protein